MPKPQIIQAYDIYNTSQMNTIFYSLIKDNISNSLIYSMSSHKSSKYKLK